MKFLETITLNDNDVLVPIDRIKYINFITHEDGYEILIVTDDGTWSENFLVNDIAKKRYKNIKMIINGQ